MHLATTYTDLTACTLHASPQEPTQDPQRTAHHKRHHLRSAQRAELSPHGEQRPYASHTFTATIRLTHRSLIVQWCHVVNIFTLRPLFTHSSPILYPCHHSVTSELCLCTTGEHPSHHGTAFLGSARDPRLPNREAHRGDSHGSRQCFLGGGR